MTQLATLLCEQIMTLHEQSFVCVISHYLDIEPSTVVGHSQGDIASIVGVVFGVFALLLIALVLVVVFLVVYKRSRGKVHK